MWHWGRRGGGPNYTHELASALAGHDNLRVHLSLSRQSECFSRSAALGLPGFHVDTYRNLFSCLLASSSLPRLRRRFFDYLVSQEIDLVYCTMTHLWNLHMLDAVRRAGAGYLLTVHDAVLHRGEQSFFRQKMITREIGLADRLVTLTEYVKGQCVDLHGVSPDMIHVVPHGPFQHGVDLIRTRKYPTNGRFNLLFFGRVLAYKGLRVLLDAFELVKQRHPQTRLYILGKGNLGIDHSRLQRSGIKLDNRWIPEDEVGSVFDKCDLLVAPYQEASQSGVIPLAFAKGIPVVATPVGGLTEQVTHGLTGLISPDLSASSLAETLGKVIGDPRQYEALSSGALSLAKGQIAWPNLAGAIAQIIEKLNRGKIPPPPTAR